MDEEQRQGFMWLGLEISLWNVLTIHVKPEPHISVFLKENPMLLQIIDYKKEQYIVTPSGWQNQEKVFKDKFLQLLLKLYP